jgi:nucleoside-diphosphate-sugar epimerase
MRVFVAGATGVIGRILVPLLVTAGYEVTGTTRAADRVAAIEATGAHAVVVDAFDRAALTAALTAARPDVVIHQLTDLTTPPGRGLSDLEIGRNARLREEGTANLVAAVVAAEAGRLIAGSIAWIYEDGEEPRTEEDPLQSAEGPYATPTRRAVHELERLVTGDERFEGIVLRYGHFYGPGTWSEAPPEPPTVHVEAAATATLLAVARGDAGIYNVVDDDGPVSNVKARSVLGWSP